MQCVVLIYPRLDEALVGRLRRRYDPTTDLIPPHVPVVYPVPESVGLDNLVSHVQSVAEDIRPFEIQFGALRKSRDHWLFLIPANGMERVKRLHELLHTGILAEYRSTDTEFVPHLGLGLFLREGSTYDWTHPREEDFDADRYEKALGEAQPLLAGPAEYIETLHLVAIPDEVLEWSCGERATFSPELRVHGLHTFQLHA